MPVVGWICPATRARVPFDHFDHCNHGPRKATAYSPFLARLAAEKAAGDVRHSTLDLTATGIMGCPRELYLERTTNYYALPSAPMHRGTALHSVAARYLNPEIWSTEATDPVRHDLRGTIGPFQVSALADAWRRDLSEIGDFKFPTDWQVRYRKKDGTPKLEHAVQLNIERHLMAQQPWAIAEGFDPAQVRLTVWDHALGTDEGPLAQTCNHMTVEEILATRPAGSLMTIADHASLIMQIREQHETIASGDNEAKTRLAASIPLVGQTMYNAKKCDKYCALKTQCDELVRQYGVPA